ncbi:MAG: Na+:solute symporter [Candidatus Lindowbacteria bacterium]|nr:Na+:solute symporter [Candidatus Lindowbacteria bacterium]
MHTIDWLIVVAYCLASLAIGFIFAKRAGKSLSDFVLSGRNLPWWLAGTSMVATTFAADTPLAITGIVRTKGIAGNWFWWNLVMSSMLWTFFYARLWRRTGVLTDVEFIELRYSGRPAAFLRGLKAFYSAILVNCIVMGWVILAMTKIGSVVFEMYGTDAVRLPVIDAEVSLDSVVTVASVLTALIYSVLSGMWGVVVTDFLQFAIAMFGSIALAVIAMKHIGGIGNIRPMMDAAVAAPPSVLRFAPEPGAGRLALVTFGVYLGVQWWAFRNADGGEYIGLRAMACRDEKHARLSLLWYSFAHYVLRPWPWILVALVSIVVYPDLADPESGYPKMMIDFLPAGLRGLMVASILAAFMSTVDTHLHWGASYLANDIYKRFIHPDASEKHYVLASRVAMLIMAALAIWTSSVMGSIEWAWKFLVAIGAGIGPVYLLRWYWWRINAWSEITAMLCSLMTAIIIFKLTPLGAREYEGVRLLIIVAVSTTAWLTVTLLSRPANRKNLREFYERVRPGGPGWRPVEQEFALSSPHSGFRDIGGVLSGSVFIYTSLFSLGKLLLGFPLSTWLPLGLAALASGAVMFACLKD